MIVKEYLGIIGAYIARLGTKLSTLGRIVVDDSKLCARAFTYVFGGSAFLFCMYSGGIVLFFLLFLLAMISAFEWHEITRGKKWLYIPAIFIIVFPYVSMAYIYTLPHGAIVLLWLVLSVWSTDTAAYFLGKNFGKRKIIPAISPNKTWVGLWGGIAFSAINTLVMSIAFGIFFVPHSLIIGAIVAVVAQLGDFTESAIKRLCNVKDSGVMMPGHGGVLDRMDGFIFTAPLVAYCIKHISKFFAAV